MLYTIVSINRNIETTCECGSTCEKISFDVVNELGDSFTYGSSCIKSVLGIDTKHLESVKGHYFINLEVYKYNEENDAYFARYKDLKHYASTTKVVFKDVIIWGSDSLSLSKDKTTIYYEVKATKKQLESIKKVQLLEVGSYLDF